MKKVVIYVGEDIKKFIASEKLHSRESYDEALRRILVDLKVLKGGLKKKNE